LKSNSSCKIKPGYSQWNTIPHRTCPSATYCFCWFLWIPLHISIMWKVLK